MFAQLVCLQVYIGPEHDKLLLQAFAISTQVVVFPEVLFERVVIAVVMRLPRVLPIAEKAALVSFAAVFVQLIVVVKSLAAEGA